MALNRVTKEDWSCGISTEASCWACCICVINICILVIWSWRSPLLCLFIGNVLLFLNGTLKKKQHGITAEFSLHLHILFGKKWTLPVHFWWNESPVIAGHLREREKYKLVFHCGAGRAGVRDGCAYERKTLTVIILSIVPWDSSVIQRTI